MKEQDSREFSTQRHRFRLAPFGLLTIVLFLAGPSYADDAKLVQWHRTNLQLLQGYNFELGNSDRTIITLQHSNGWTYGDNSLFYDKTLKGQDYFEWHPRLSLSKLSGKAIKLGPIKDISLAGTLEVPEQSSARFLGGLGFDWSVSSFDFVKTNFYIRDNPDLEGTTWGATFSWKNQFTIGSQPFLFDGFIDLAGSEGNRDAYQLLVPALLADIGMHFGHNDRLYLGLEYQYWHNKFGLPGVTESTPQVELRWVIR